MTLRVKSFTILIASLAPLVSPADPADGASRSAVIDELGEPTGKLTLGEREELHYPRGHVVLKNGFVTEVDLLSLREWNRRETVRLLAEKTKAETEARETAGLAERRRKGAEALNLLLADARWKDAAAETRVETLARFAKAYPDADISAVKLDADRKYALEVAEKRRLQDLETRVAAAETRAGEAEVRARVAEARAQESRDAAKRAEASEYIRRANEANYGLRTGTYVGVPIVNGRPYWNYPYGGSSVSISNGNIVITGGGVPPCVSPRPIVIVNPRPPVTTPPAPKK